VFSLTEERMKQWKKYRFFRRKSFPHYRHGCKNTAKVRAIYATNHLITGTEHHHYQVLRMGWNGRCPIFDPPVHFEIRDGKAWLQANFTDADVAKDLVQAGVAREDIVLGSQPPFMRPHTAYGVA